MNKVLIKSFDSSIRVSDGIIRYLGNENINFYSAYTNPKLNVSDLSWDTNEYWQAYGDKPTLEITIKKYFVQLTTFAFKGAKDSCFQTKFAIYGIDKYNKQHEIGTYVSSEFNFCSSPSSLPVHCPTNNPVLIPALSNKDVPYKKFIIKSTEGSCDSDTDHLAFSGIEIFGITCKLSSNNPLSLAMFMHIIFV